MGYIWIRWLPQLLVLVCYAWMIRWAMRRLGREFSGAEPARLSPPRQPATGSAGFLGRSQAPQL
jgi:hypothetical protein